MRMQYLCMLYLTELLPLVQLVHKSISYKVMLAAKICESQRTIKHLIVINKIITKNHTLVGYTTV